MTKQSNVERFNHWMTEIVKSEWVNNDKAMCQARAKVATHHIVTAKKRIDVRIT